MKKLMLLILVLGVLVAGILTCTFQVDETEFAIVARFGDPRREVSRAGLHFKLPAPIDTVIFIDRRLHVLDPDPGEYLTSDKKNILVNCYMTWRVSEPRKYLVSATNRVAAEARLSDVLRSEVGTVLGSNSLSSLVSVETQERGMEDIMREVTARAASKAEESFGIEVTSIRIKRLNFPSANKQAVFRRMEAERQRIARLHRSEGEEEAVKIRSRAQREQAELINEATRTAEETRGAGEAEAIRILNEAHGQDREFYEFVRSLATLEKTVRENSTFVIPSDWKLLDVLKDPRIDFPEKAKNDDGSSPPKPSGGQKQ